MSAMSPVNNNSAPQQTQSKMNREIDQVSQLLATSKRQYAHPSVDKAAIKDGNMNDIMQYNYMRDYVRMRHDQDREQFLDNKIRGIKPIFKNF